MEYCAYGNLHDCIHSMNRSMGRTGRAARRKTEKGIALEASLRTSRRPRGKRFLKSLDLSNT